MSNSDKIEDCTASRSYLKKKVNIESFEEIKDPLSSNLIQTSKTSEISDEISSVLNDKKKVKKKSIKKTRFKVKKIDNTMKNKIDQDDQEATVEVFENPLPDDQNNKASFGSASLSSSRSTSESENTYNTQYLKSLRHYTREPLPKVSHYRNTLSLHTHQNRPSLDELHNPNSSLGPESVKLLPKKKRSNETLPSAGAIKLGWIQGVFIRCLLNIWGVMLFLRLPWVVGQAGIINAILIILLATLVTTITTVSMSAICTNGEVKGGGAYYMISRSLGPEFGGAIGAIFSLANAVAVAMYVVGFCESFLGLLKENEIMIVDGGIQDIRIIGLVVVTILLGIALIGMEWENKAQIFLLIILLSAMFNFFVGTFIPPDRIQKSQGFFGYRKELFFENLFSDYRGHSFISVFSIIFPAATGILAGANISGDLSRPSEAIPKGTFLAILVTSISYILFMILCGVTMLRDANGFISDYLTIPIVSECFRGPKHSCVFGLMNSDKVMIMIAPFSFIIYAGIFAATLSSALASLVSAPKVFQALCKDNLFPYIHVFGKGTGKSNEPKRAYLLTYFIAVSCILIGQLNAIAPIISNFFLAAYTIINFSCFHLSFSKTPGFRPAFKYYNKYVSLLGSFFCLGVMFIMNWSTALLTFVLMLFLFIYIHYRKPDVNWGSSTQAEAYIRALKAVKKMIEIPDHVKTFRPQVLVLTGNPSSRPALIDFANCVTKKFSLLVSGHIITNEIPTKSRRALTHRVVKYFQKRKIDAFYEIKIGKTLSEGALALMELSGLGKLKPNILLIGYKNDWCECPSYELLEYFKTIHYAFDLHMSVCILRLPGGLDISEFEEPDGITEGELINAKKYYENDAGIELVIQGTNDRGTDFMNIPRNASSAQLSNVLRPTVSWFELFAAFKVAGGENSTTSTPRLSRSNYSELKVADDHETSLGISKEDSQKSKSITLPVSEKNTTDKEDNQNFCIKVPSDSKLNIPKIKEMSTKNKFFSKKQKKGTIDVWWLYDDGGLTMLIPHIISNRSMFENCTLRVFTLANRKDELDREKRNMAALLSKFRIGFSDVTVIPDIVKPPKEETIKEFQKLIAKFKANENSKENLTNECLISESELINLKDKNNRHIRLRELLLEHSKDAALIVMTLTVPRKGICSAPLFMSWLEILTHDMPPFLLVRGNQTSVLTFYS